MGKAWPFGDLIRSARERKGLSAAEVAAELGVSRQYVYMLEVGSTTTPSLALARKLSDLLGVPLNKLADAIPNGPPTRRRGK